MRTLIVLVFLSMVLSDKWSNLKSPNKYLEKKARHREVKEKVFKKDTGYNKKEKVKPYNKKTDKDTYLEEDGIPEETFLKNERWLLCLTVDEDNVKNTLLKFGLVTHMFDDVVKFRKTLKSLQDQIPTEKKDKKIKKGGKDKLLLVGKEEGTNVKHTQGNWVGRAMGVSEPQFLSYLFDDGANWSIDYGTNNVGRRRKRQTYRETMFNKLGGLKTRQRKGTVKVPDEVPHCFGWKYLKGLDALLEDNTVDTEVLSQSVSDMLDVKFSEAVNSIITGCGEILNGGEALNLCPPPPPPEEGECVEHEMEDQCRVDTQCQYREMCCRNSCGGYKCLPRQKAKAHSCQAGDQFMQCIYQRINNELCDGK